MADAAVATPAPAAPASTPTNGATAETKPTNTGTTVPTRAPAKPNGKAAAEARAAEALPDAEGEGGEAKPPPTAEDFLEVVVKGEKRRLTREEAIRKLQKEEAAAENFRSAKELARKVQSAIGQMKEDPLGAAAALKEAGVDPEAFARAILHKRIEAEVEAQLPEEEKQALAEKRELEQLRAELKKRDEAAAKAQQEETDKAAFAALEKQLLGTAQKHGVEGTPDNLYRLAEIADEFLELNIPLNDEHLVAELKEREDRAFTALEKRVLSGLKGEALAKRLGQPVVEEILRWSVERLRGGGATPPPAPAAAAPKAEKETHYITEAELRRKHGW